MGHECCTCKYVSPNAPTAPQYRRYPKGKLSVASITLEGKEFKFLRRHCEWCGRWVSDATEILMNQDVDFSNLHILGGTIPLKPGCYEVEGEHFDVVDVYEHPELGLCVWGEDVGREIDHAFDHIPVHNAGIHFIRMTSMIACGAL